MSCITNCTACGHAYEEASEELANHPGDRHCPGCTLRLHGLTEEQWIDLAKRVGAGMAVDRDADYVEAIGLLPQAMKIRHGLSTHQDGILVNLQAGLRFIDLAKEKRGRVAA